MNRSTENPKYWSPVRCAERWDVTRSTISIWMQDGTIPPETIVRIGRVKRINLDLCEEIWSEKRAPGRPALVEAARQ